MVSKCHLHEFGSFVCYIPISNDLPFAYQSPNLLPFKEPWNQFRRIDSASLCSLAGRCSNMVVVPFRTEGWESIPGLLKKFTKSLQALFCLCRPFSFKAKFSLLSIGHFIWRTFIKIVKRFKKMNWTLKRSETEVYGDSKKTNERGPFLVVVGSLESGTTDFCSALAAL